MSLKSYFSGFGGWLWEEENPLRLSSFLPTTLANYYHDSAYNDDDEDGGRGLNPPSIVQVSKLYKRMYGWKIGGRIIDL